MKQHHKLTVALCLIWAATILYGEMFAFWVPSLWTCSWPHNVLKKDKLEDSGSFTKVAVITDPQLMDKSSLRLPPRSFVLEAAEFYTDLYMHRAFFQSILPFKPDMILFLGDYFDGGPFLSDEEWQESLSRFRHIFGLTARDRVGHIPVYYIPGNHDIGYSRIISHKPEVIERYEKEFGARNYKLIIGSVEFISIDSQTLDGNAQGKLASATWDFIKNVSMDAQSRPRVLLTHIPLYRPDRTSCGPRRSSSVIDQRMWRSPQDQEITYQNYISRESSNKLLDLIKPVLILSGHDHDQCTVTQESKPGPVTEQTLGTVSWQQGNSHPSFMLLSVSNSPALNSSSFDKALHTQLCFLPVQLHIYLWYLSLFVLTLVVLPLWPNHGISFLNDLMESSKNMINSILSTSGTKEKNEDENCEYEMVWDAEGSMHLVKKVLETHKRPSDKGVVERGNAVMRSAARKNVSEEIGIIMDANASAGSDPLARSASKTEKPRAKLVIQRLIRTIKMLIVIAALNVPIYMMLLFKDWIDQ